MLIVSHDTEEVRRLCDRVYIMVAGRVAGKLDLLSDINGVSRSKCTVRGLVS
ncbi:MAG: hypothetical protein ACO2OR_02560 [Desulfurococcaceae archaeon]